MRKLAVVILLGLCVLSAENAYTQNYPQLRIGDTWRFKQTIDEPTKSPASMVTPNFILNYENAAGDFVMATKSVTNGRTTIVGRLVGPVSSKSCLFDVLANKGIVQNCNVQLESGKSWSTDESNTIDRTQETLKIETVETVEVPAGKFIATKIVSEKTVTEFPFKGVPEPNGGYTTKTVTTYWYCPDVKAMVKIVRERSNSKGRISTLTDELDFYSPGTSK